MMDRYAHYQRLKFDQPAERVLRITMDIPPVNAADAPMHRELVDVWSDVERDPDISVAILCSAGKAFSGGADFAVIEGIIDSHERKLEMFKEARDLVYNIINCPKPVVAAIQGAAVGAGLAAGLVSDVVIAARSARIIDGHTRLGVAAGDHAVMIWPLLCGMAKAKYHLLTCEPLSGEEAERLGLVSLCVDDEVLQEKAVEVASRLASGAQTAIRFTKYALNNWLRMMGPNFDASLALEFLAWDGPEAKEGLASLQEKRDPKFPPDSPI